MITDTGNLIKTSKLLTTKTLYEYFKEIGHSHIESQIQNTIHDILDSFLETFSNQIRLFYFYGSSSIVGPQLLKEIEAKNITHDFIELLNVFTKRNEDLYFLYSEKIIEEFSAMGSTNTAINFSLKQLSEHKMNYVNQCCQLPNDITTESLLQDTIKIINDDITCNRVKPNFVFGNEEFEELFQKAKEESESFKTVVNTKTQNYIYQGEVGDNLPEGLGILYEEDGVKSCQGTFKKGQLEGQKCMMFNTDGNLVSYGAYLHGKKNGYGEEFDDNGVLRKRGQYIHDVLNGDNCEEFHKHGNLKYIGEIKNGLYYGQGQIYYENGVLKYQGKFESGLPSCDKGIIYNKDNGDIRYIGGQVRGQYYGFGRIFKTGVEQPILEGFFIEGKLNNGNVQTFFENGNPEYIGQFKNGYYEGRGCMYHRIGSRKVYEGILSNGRETGREIVLYDKNGRIVFLGDMTEGNYNGNVELYNGYQKLCEFSGTYNNGEAMNNSISDINDIKDLEELIEESVQRSRRTCAGVKLKKDNNDQLNDSIQKMNDLVNITNTKQGCQII